MVAQQVRSTRCWRSCTTTPPPCTVPRVESHHLQLRACTALSEGLWTCAAYSSCSPTVHTWTCLTHSHDAQDSARQRRLQTQTNHGQKESTAGERVILPGSRLFPVGLLFSKPSGYHWKGKEQKYQTLKSFISTTDEFTVTQTTH